MGQWTWNRELDSACPRTMLIAWWTATLYPVKLLASDWGQPPLHHHNRSLHTNWPCWPWDWRFLWTTISCNWPKTEEGSVSSSRRIGMPKLEMTQWIAGMEYVDITLTWRPMIKDKDSSNLKSLMELLLCDHLWPTCEFQKNGLGTTQNGKHHNQIDYILVQKVFHTSVNTNMDKELFLGWMLEVIKLQRLSKLEKNK